MQPGPAGVQQPEFTPDFAAPAPLDTAQPGGHGALSMRSREAAPPLFGKGVQPLHARHSALQRQQPAALHGQPDPVQQQQQQQAQQSSSDAQRSAKHQAALDEAQQQRNPSFPRQRQGTGLSASRPPWPTGPHGHFLNMRLASGQ